MLKLTDIKKTYVVGETEVHALKGINISFREHEFVSILGQSGCGKTTLLNIVGGLDQYTSGDLIINGVSTKEYKDHDWDTYRNHTIGFVFQNYNLIPHQTVLSNVELALTLSGVSKEERRNRAIEVLKKVGLGDQLNKKPNQMSGGQMQRVAIARALVNNPDILLADEPTGALDTETSVQIMELLKEVAKDKLVIMVTHNPELAELYSTRIIKLLDGNVIDDTLPVKEEELKDIAEDSESLKKARTSMGFGTALALSLNNLMTKKARTFLTAFAGSIGIIGIALILSLSNGIQEYIDSVEEEALSSYPITVEKEVVDMTSIMEAMMGDYDNPDNDPNKIYSKNVVSQALKTMISESKTNNLESFKEYLDNSKDIADCTNAIQYTYNVRPIIFLDKPGEAQQVNPLNLNAGAAATMSGSFMSNPWSEMIDNKQLLESQYDVIAGKWPEAANEAVLVVDEYNQIYDLTLYALGIRDLSDLYKMMMSAAGNLGDKDTADSIDDEDTIYNFEDILGLTYKLVLPSDYYQYDKESDTYVDMSQDTEYMKNVVANAYQINLVGILRVKPDTVSTTLGPGTIAYTNKLTEYYITQIQNSDVVKAQLADETRDVLTGLKFDTGEEDLTSSEKAQKFNEYALNLVPNDKAALFLKIYSAPSDEEINAMIEEYKASYPDKDSKIGFIADSMITAIKEVKNGNLSPDALAASGLDSETLEYIQSLSDDNIKDMMTQTYSQIDDATLDVMFEQGLRESITAMYSAQLAESFNTYSNDELCEMFDNYLGGKSEEDLAKMFDRFMPSIYSSSSYDDNLQLLGLRYLEDPNSINIYAKSFDDKEKLMDLIDKYNESVEEADEITYTDYVGLMMSSVTKIINIISYVLIAFVSISLVVSSIMIGIITYISVLERTKEIGILRSIGASKKDISRVFNAEAIIIGFVSGAIGILVTVLLDIPISIIIKKLTDVGSIAKLPIAGGIILVAISMFLTFIAGLIPSRVAAKKDPVLALRSE